MYLVLVDNSFISPEDLQKMIEQYQPEADVVNSASADTLLKIAEKLSPETIIIDFNMVKEHRTVYFQNLREVSEKSYILVLIDPELYDRLDMVVELGGIDGYLTKPIQSEEFMARLHIADKRQGLQIDKRDKPVAEPEDKSLRKTIDQERFVEPVEDDIHAEKEPAEQFTPYQREDDELEPPPEAETSLADDHDRFGHKIPGLQPEEIMGERDSADILSSEDKIEQHIPKEINEIPPAYKEPVNTEVKEDSFDSLFSDVVFDDKLKPARKDPDDAVIKPAEEFPDHRETADYKESFKERELPRPDLSIPSSLPGNSANEYLSEEDEFSAEAYTQSLEEELVKTEADIPKRRSRSKKRKSGGGGGFVRFLSIIGSMVFVLVLIAMAVISLFLIQSRVSGEIPQVAGYKFQIVSSDSMSPTLDGGSMAVIQDIKPEQVIAGDIIAYRGQDDPNIIITHRVVGVILEDGLEFTTKGDASSVNDPSPVPAVNVVGRVTNFVPYLGMIMEFAQTQQGLILLIFVPGALIIIYELGKIIKHLSKDKDNKKRKRSKKRTRPAEEKY